VVDVTDDGDRAGAASAALAAEPRTTEWTAPPLDEPAVAHDPDDREFQPRNEDIYGDMDHARGRHVTWRVVTFVVAFLVILAVAVGAVGWAAKRTYFVGFSGANVAIYQGRPGGLLWIDPKLEDVSNVRRGDLTDAQREDVTSNPKFSSLSDARSYTNNIESSVRAATTTTTTTPPKTSSTSTTRPTTTTTR
jgi:PPM family protein phosphatase